MKMESSKVINYSNVHEKLHAACDILNWNFATQNWNSPDGNWYSLSAEKLKNLERCFKIFIESCELGFDIQFLIVTKYFEFVKNIMMHQEPYTSHSKTPNNFWRFVFSIVQGNNETMNKVWNECGELLLMYLPQNFPDNHYCRLIVFQIYVIGRIGRNGDTKILKILLKSFNEERQVEESKKQSLYYFLKHFVCDDEDIAIMYLKLHITEKIWLLQFTNKHMKDGHVNALPLCMDLMQLITDELNSKLDYIYNKSITNDILLREIMALFQVIANASNEYSYGLNRFPCNLILNIGTLFRIVFDDEEDFAKAFLDVSSDSCSSLKLLLLATISNIVKGNPTNREKAREGGLIDCLIDFLIAKVTDPLIYRNTIFTLIDICHKNPTNHEHVVNQVKRKEYIESDILRLLLLDIRYERKQL